MRKKLSLELDGLRVDSFETSPKKEEERGTVLANAAACTCFASCLCPSAYYYCGDGYHTIYSCDYTRNPSCYF